MGGFNLIKTFNDGGPVMYPLLLMSVLAITFVIERIIMLIVLKRKVSPADFMAKMDEVLQKQPDKTKAAAELTVFCREKGGPVSEVMLEGLNKYKEAVDHKLSLLEAKEWINQAVEEKGAVEVPTLEKHLSVLSTVAMVSPLLGLLGTVTGMIRAFTIMAQSAGGAKPDELAGGIAEALITTATGLIIAIPTLLVYNWLRAAIDNLVLEMEEVAMLLTDNLIRK